jgi:hypothetical protein
MAHPFVVESELPCEPPVPLPYWFLSVVPALMPPFSSKVSEALPPTPSGSALPVTLVLFLRPKFHSSALSTSLLRSFE